MLNAAVKGLHVGQAELLPLMVSMAQGKVETYTWGNLGQLWGEQVTFKAPVSR